MRRIGFHLAFLLLLVTLLTGCGSNSAVDSPEPQTAPQPQADQAALVSTDETPEASSPPFAPEPKEENQPSDNAPLETAKPTSTAFNIEDVPAYSGQAYVVLN